MIEKKEFCRIINEVKRYQEFRDKINDLLGTVIDSPDLTDWCIYLLDVAMGIDITTDTYKKYGSDIGHFVYELNFGENWTPKSITMDGKSVDISTAEKLYDYLVSSS